MIGLALQELKQVDSINYILSRIISEKILMPSVPIIYIKTIEPGFKFGPHNHEYIEVVSVLYGTCYMVINNEHIKLRKNECLIIFPDISHQFYVESSKECRIINVHFTPGDISAFFDTPDLQDSLRFFYELKTNTMRYLRLIDNSFIRFISERIYDEIKNKNDFSEISLKLHFCELYVRLSKIINETYNIFIKPVNKHVTGALEYIRNFYTEKLTIEHVAAHVKLSPRQLTRLFSKELNTTIQDYINTLRLEKAKDLLRSTDLNVTRVAHSLGFNTSEYFTTCFKKSVGMTPKKYRDINNLQG